MKEHKSNEMDVENILKVLIGFPEMFWLDISTFVFHQEIIIT